MDQQVMFSSKHKSLDVCLVKAKSNKMGEFYQLLSIDPKPSDLTKGRPMWAEPVYVAKY